MFNLKNKVCQEKFKELTSKTNIMTNVFNNSDDINTCTKQFLKSLDKCIRICFKKVRITEKTNSEIDALFYQNCSIIHKVRG